MTDATWTAPEVVRRGGELDAPETVLLTGLLDWHRATFLDRLTGLDGAALARHTVEPSTLTLLGLLRHLTKVERYWWRICLAGEDIDSVFPMGTDIDFDELDPAEAEHWYAAYLDEVAAARRVAGAYALDDTFADRHGTRRSVRMLHLHLLGEYARHNGHADLLRERTDGRAGA